jgi:hypothetical protein
MEAKSQEYTKEKEKLNVNPLSCGLMVDGLERA